jgi:hypothetical protein
MHARPAQGGQARSDDRTDRPGPPAFPVKRGWIMFFVFFSR